MRLAGKVVTRLAALLLAAAGWSGAALAANSSQTPWGPDYFPNVPLVTQDGKSVRFFDDLIKGKVVAINFVFTSCSASCPMETARLRQVQQLLGDRMGKDVFFYSISIDPENDTPAVLKQYAARFDLGPGWTFLTGRRQDIDLLRQRLGLYMPALPARTAGTNDHDLSLVVGNQGTGRWMKASPFENPEVLATQLGSWLHNWKVASVRADPSYAEAPVRLPQQSRGEELFRTRCASCHTVGAPANSLAALRAIGPDLAGVTRSRDRLWLLRWLREPDVMLAEKDPIATALYQKYNKVTMPNLRLGVGDIAALVTFLEEQDPAVARK
ncbi:MULTISPECIES: SCO family protein [Ramlibacter]|uniref:C-type cytochrome n=1 Tax=Ramlibacter pinisoli TaxID=2682844 RepID=A0A6N8IYW9_9BURK|nr:MULTISPECIES: SCO family protein [Ramlibacter]MBA2961843.1 SCO family protein [Ramlibacter sp. CGMCC 1.13660]MVQ31785.1 c-type cytochrome [Ramlibacter pinisoli]